MAHLFPSTSQPLPSSAISATPQLSFQSTFDDGTNLQLSPESLKTLVRYHASGQLATLLSHLPQHTPAGTSAATTKRTTARSHSDLGILESSGPSAYTHAATIPKPVPQPLDAARYQPPPMKARARRIARAEKGKANAAMTVIADAWGQGAENVPLSSLPSGATTRPAPHKAIATTPTLSAEPPASSAAQPSLSWGELAKIISNPALRPTMSDSDQARAICQQPGLEGLPVRLVERVLPRLRGVEAATNSHRSSSPSARHENPHPVGVEALRTEMTSVLPVPPVSVDQPTSSEYWSMTYAPERTPQMASTTLTAERLSETEGELTPAAPLLTWEDFIQSEYPSIAAAAQERSPEGKQIETPEHLFDHDFSYGSNTAIIPPTYQDIQRSLFSLPNHLDQFTEWGSEGEANTNETGTAPGDLAFNSGAPDEDWGRFFAFPDSA